MKRIFFILILLLSVHLFLFSQTDSEIDSLLNKISQVENSKNIATNPNSVIVMEYGLDILPTLANFFTDTTITNIYSDCLERNLNKGEIAYILSYRPEYMPYFTLTGIQNCLLTFCENNLNWIEYYLDVNQRDNVGNFQAKYRDWLDGEERVDWTSLVSKKSKKELRKEKRKKKWKRRNKN